jgi:hypothetical protein
VCAVKSAIRELDETQKRFAAAPQLPPRDSGA